MGPHWKGTLSLQTSPGQTWFCTVAASPEEGQPSAEPALCPSVTGSPSDVCSVSRRTPHYLSALQKWPRHPWGVYHPLKGSLGGVPGYCCCWFFPMPCTSEEIFCLPYLYGQGSTRGEEMAGLLCPLLRGGKPRMTAEVMSCSYTCVTDFSPSSALSSAEAELQLEAGTGFLRKEEKLGNVYWLVRKLGDFSKNLSGCLFLPK